MAKIAFKPYACGTMLHPFIDCAIRLAREGVAAADVREVVCRVGEGTVHRLWEPLAEKRTPTTSYSAKFSGPFAVALGLIEQAAGLEQFTEAKVRDPDLLALAAKVALRDRPRERVPAQLHRRRPRGAARTAASARPISPICAAACASRSGVPRSRPSSAPMPPMAAGRKARPARLEAWCGRLFELFDLGALATFRC